MESVSTVMATIVGGKTDVINNKTVSQEAQDLSSAFLFSFVCIVVVHIIILNKNSDFKKNVNPRLMKCLCRPIVCLLGGVLAYFCFCFFFSFGFFVLFCFVCFCFCFLFLVFGLFVCFYCCLFSLFVLISFFVLFILPVTFFSLVVFSFCVGVFIVGFVLFCWCYSFVLFWFFLQHNYNQEGGSAWWLPPPLIFSMKCTNI